MSPRVPSTRSMHPGLATWTAIALFALFCLAMGVPKASGTTGVAVPALESIDRDFTYVAPGSG